MMKHLNVISCGQGAPSLFLIVLAGEGAFPADTVIVADTGWENDMLWNTGERTTAKDFFDSVTKRLAESYGMSAHFVRTQDKYGKDYPPLSHDVGMSFDKSPSPSGTPRVSIPLFGSNGGRLKQACTSKWKIQGIRQEIRRQGADTATSYLGISLDEAGRMKASDVKWNWPAWPLVDYTSDVNGETHSMNIGRMWRREEIRQEMERRNINYLVSSECDGCPHKDWQRWKRTDPRVIDEVARQEEMLGGEFFFTDRRVPLKNALREMSNRESMGLFDELDVCESGYCFT